MGPKVNRPETAYAPRRRQIAGLQLQSNGRMMANRGHHADLDEKAGTVRVLHGKGDKSRTVGLDPDGFAYVSR